MCGLRGTLDWEIRIEAEMDAKPHHIELSYPDRMQRSRRAPVEQPNTIYTPHGSRTSTPAR
jgi:hypothetical protein